MEKRNKHGAVELGYETILDLVMVGLIAVLLFGVVNALQDNTLHNQQVLARDFGLVYDSMRGASGQVVYPFVAKKNLQVMVDDECKIIVQDKEKQRGSSFFFCGNAVEKKIRITEKEGDVVVYEFQHV
jgi:hypothetical protein